MKIYSFEKLDAFDLAHRVVIQVYRVTGSFPRSEMFGLTSQIRRASVSIISNLAEGSGRMSSKDKAHFTSLSYSSLMEVLCQLQIALQLDYLTTSDYESIRTHIDKLSYILTKLRNSQLSTP